MTSKLVWPKSQKQLIEYCLEENEKQQTINPEEMRSNSMQKQTSMK